MGLARICAGGAQQSASLPLTSIRKEAFNNLDHYDRNAVNINSLVIQLHYTSDELSRIVDKNIAFMKRDNLVQSKGGTPLARFVGASNIRIVNPITKKS